MSDKILKDFPVLSKMVDWEVVKAHFKLNKEIEESLVSNISIIPYVGDKYVIIQTDAGMWELPGGTLDDGEHYLDALKRETMEELGAELLSYHIFGQFQCISIAETPYRPHIPHPNFVRIVGYGEVNIVGKPLNPADGEQVVVVELVDIDEAILRFAENNRDDIGELYRLAHRIRYDME